MRPSAPHNTICTFPSPWGRLLRNAAVCAPPHHLRTSWGLLAPRTVVFTPSRRLAPRSAVCMLAMPGHALCAVGCLVRGPANCTPYSQCPDTVYSRLVAPSRTPRRRLHACPAIPHPTAPSRALAAPSRPTGPPAHNTASRTLCAVTPPSRAAQSPRRHLSPRAAVARSRDGAPPPPPRCLCDWVSGLWYPTEWAAPHRRAPRPTDTPRAPVKCLAPSRRRLAPHQRHTRCRAVVPPLAAVSQRRLTPSPRRHVPPSSSLGCHRAPFVTPSRAVARPLAP
ncbi:hypothetical protein DENSPDRAFT_887193 [Dentipellis sp. KUC8613]|nr:hypothetical protein DENSPDRAFT_887193 [Dentipellis sp. KUC8613]